MPDYRVQVRHSIPFAAGTPHEAVAMVRLAHPKAEVLQVSDFDGDCREYVGTCEACRGVLLDGDRYVLCEDGVLVHEACLEKEGEE